MRKVPFLNDQYYHIYNRGVDKRNIFANYKDIERFMESVIAFNDIVPVESIARKRIKKQQTEQSRRCLTPTGRQSLVEIIAFALNPNHFHFLLKQVSDGGISEFMKRLSGGYTNFFNAKYNRSGSLFQGKFKDAHIKSDSQLRYMSVYLNLNDRVHQKTEILGRETPKGLMKSSWEEYLRAKIVKGKIGDTNQVQNGPYDICEKSMILSHFDTIAEYKKFAEDTLKSIREERYLQDARSNLQKFFLE